MRDIIVILSAAPIGWVGTWAFDSLLWDALWAWLTKHGVQEGDLIALLTRDGLPFIAIVLIAIGSYRFGKWRQIPTLEKWRSDLGNLAAEGTALANKASGIIADQVDNWAEECRRYRARVIETVAARDDAAASKFRKLRRYNPQLNPPYFSEEHAKHVEMVREVVRLLDLLISGSSEAFFQISLSTGQSSTAQGWGTPTLTCEPYTGPLDLSHLSNKVEPMNRETRRAQRKNNVPRQIPKP